MDLTFLLMVLFLAPPYPKDTFLRTLTVNFNSPLGNFGNVPIDVTNPGRSVEILQAGADTQNPDIADVRNVVNANSPSVTGIPLETDALPVAATMAVVGGDALAPSTQARSSRTGSNSVGYL